MVHERLKIGGEDGNNLGLYADWWQCVRCIVVAREWKRVGARCNPFGGGEPALGFMLIDWWAPG